MSVRALCSLAVFCSALALRREADSITQESSENKGSFAANTYAGRAGTRGQVLRGRYRLEEFIERRDLRVSTHNSTASIFADVQEHVSDLSQVGPKAGRFPETYKDRFTSANRIAAGSFGEVWRAHDTALKKQVAIKFLLKQQRTGPEFMTGWDASLPGWLSNLKGEVQECELVQQILQSANRDPQGASHICRCIEHNFDTARWSEPLFFVLEDCGKSVNAFSQMGKRPLPAWELASQLLRGLRFLQSLNLIHHDLKPDNVCINGENKVKIIDWGGVVKATEDNQKRALVHTPAYTPPEVNRQMSFGFPSYSYDVYAVGLIFFEYICGRKAFEAFYRSKSLEAAQQRCAHTPWGVDLDAIKRMIANTPKDRPSPKKAEEELKQRPLAEKMLSAVGDAMGKLGKL